MEMRSEAESSTGTEMVLASDGTMSVGGFSTQKKGKFRRYNKYIYISKRTDLPHEII